MSKGWKDTSVPCFECEDRYAGCHGKCGRYISFKHKRKALKELKDKAKLSAPPHRKGE